MTGDASTLRRRVLAAEASRSSHIQGILRESGPLRRGSLITLHRKCGKPNCHCAHDGVGHETTYLSVKQDGVTRMQYVPADRRQCVSAEASAYRLIRKHRAALAKLSQESLRLIDQYEESLQSTEPIAARSSSRKGPRGKRLQDRG